MLLTRKIYLCSFFIFYETDITDYIFKDAEGEIESPSKESNFLVSFSKIADGDYLSSEMTEVMSYTHRHPHTHTHTHLLSKADKYAVLFC